MRRSISSVLVAFLAIASACSGGGISDDGTLDAGAADVFGGPSDVGGGGDQGMLDAGWLDAGEDTGQADTGRVDAGPADAGQADAGGGDGGVVDGGRPDPAEVCRKLGLEAVGFSEGPYANARRAIAGGFSLPTLDGEWDFRAGFSGCETYVFVPEETPLTAGFPTPWWRQDLELLIWNSPPNVHYFFFAAADVAAVRDLRDRLYAFLDLITPEERAWWRERLHFVSKLPVEIGNWVGDRVGDPGLGFGIDRFQRIRDLGSPADPLRYNESRQWFEPNLSYVTHEPKYYNFEREREDRLSAETATVITVFDAETFSGARDRDVVFPDAAALAAFDTLELDLAANCPLKGPEPVECGEWDYIQALYLCDAAEPSKCDVEVGRWITTYAREGRWLTDASQTLALLRDGGARRLRFDASGQSYEVTLKLRLSSRNKGARPAEAHFLFSGGAFDTAYNDRYQPKTITVPADAKKVELFAVITGHGFGVEKENCAEFCAHEHHFEVNGTDFFKTNPAAGSYTGCADNVPNGVVPNQYGTWFFGRGGWCPGWNVAPWTADVTGAVVPGTENTITYKALLHGAPYVPEPSGGQSGFPANINMVSYLVVWK
jgi:hypothetical protein